MAKKISVILEITETHIKIAEVKEHSNGALVTNLIVENISPASDEVIAKKLASVLKKSRIKFGELVVVIPRSLVTIRNVSFPSQDPKEIQKMVELQAVRQIPYAREDVAIDHLIVGKDVSGYSQVLLVIVHKDVINRYRKLTEQSTLALHMLAFSSQGVCSLYEAYQNKIRQSEKLATLLLDIDSVNTDVCFYYNKQLLFSRSVSFGARDFDGEHAESLIRQLELTLSTYKKEKIGPDISKIIITPFNERMQALARKLETEFSIAVEIINPNTVVPLARKLPLPQQILEGQTSSAVLLGLSYAKKDSLIDLLPQEVHSQQKNTVKKKEFVTVAILLILAIISAMLTIIAQIYRKEQYVKYLDASLKQTDPDAKDITLMTKQIELIKKRTNPAISSIDVLYELYSLLPENMSLSVFGLEEQGNLSLQGVALNMSDVFEFQGRLDKSAYFSNVEVKYASKRRTRTGEMTDFRIVCAVGKKGSQE